MGDLINNCFRCKRFDCVDCPLLEDNLKKAVEFADAIANMLFGRTGGIEADRIKEE